MLQLTTQHRGKASPKGLQNETCIICGTSPSLWEDLKSTQFLLQDTPYDVVAVNDAIAYLPFPIHHAVSLHASLFMSSWIKLHQRRFKLEESPLYIHCTAHDVCSQATHVWSDTPSLSTSGIFALFVAHFFYKQAYLVGFSKYRGHFYSSQSKTSIPHITYGNQDVQVLNLINEKMQISPNGIFNFRSK